MLAIQFILNYNDLKKIGQILNDGSQYVLKSFYKPQANARNSLNPENCEV